MIMVVIVLLSSFVIDNYDSVGLSACISVYILILVVMMIVSSTGIVDNCSS